MRNLVICHPRCGSSAYIEHLYTLENIRPTGFSEILSLKEDNHFTNNEFLRKINLQENYTIHNAQDVKEIIKLCINNNVPLNLKFFPQWQCQWDEDILSYIIDHYEFNVTLLYRESLVETLTSYVLATYTGLWSSDFHTTHTHSFFALEKDITRTVNGVLYDSIIPFLEIANSMNTTKKITYEKDIYNKLNHITLKKLYKNGEKEIILHNYMELILSLIHKAGLGEKICVN